MSNTLVNNPLKHIDIKKPTHVDVQRVHEIKSPKNFDLLLIKSLVLSKIDPHTTIDVNP